MLGARKTTPMQANRSGRAIRDEETEKRKWNRILAMRKAQERKGEV